jgi:hypothetical protein
MNRAAVNMDEQVFVEYNVKSFGQYAMDKYSWALW